MIVPMEHNVPLELAPGKYQYRADVNGGTITVQLGDGAGGFQTMVDGVFSANSDGSILITSFPIQVQLTGAAAFALSRSQRGS